MSLRTNWVNVHWSTDIKTNDCVWSPIFLILPFHYFFFPLIAATRFHYFYSRFCMRYGIGMNIYGQPKHSLRMKHAGNAREMERERKRDGTYYRGSKSYMVYTHTWYEYSRYMPLCCENMTDNLWSNTIESHDVWMCCAFYFGLIRNVECSYE